MKSILKKKDLQGFLILLVILPLLFLGNRALATAVDTAHNYIAKGEYWIDNRASGSTTVTTNRYNADSSQAAFSNIQINTSTLSSGRHSLYFRMQDRRGKWGPVRQTVFTIGTLPTDNKLIAGQFYWGNNPDQKYELTGTYNLNHVEISNSLTAPATKGRFTLFTRFQDARGKWGPTRATMITVGGLPSDNKIAAGQYYWSNNAAQKYDLTGTYDQNFVQISNQITSPASDGVYTLFTRFRDTRGKWGAVRGTQIKVSSQTDFQNKIVAGEYFWTHDPSVRTALSGTLNGNLVEIAQSISAPATEGVYQLNVHFKDARGRWGPIRKSNVKVDEALAPPIIAQAEYYFDSDPGNGNGFIVTEGTFGAQTASFIKEVALSGSGLNVGGHSVFTRFMNNRGEWGDAASRNFEIQVKPQIIVSKASLEFGQVVIGSNRSRSFAIRNGGDDTLRVTNIALSVGTNPGYQIQPNNGKLGPFSPDSIVVYVTFTSSEPAGNKNATLIIDNNDQQKTVNLIAESVITPTPTIEIVSDKNLPLAALQFGPLAVGRDTTINFKINNLGTNTLVVSNIASSNDQIFRVTSPTSFPANVQLGTPLNVAVKFIPAQYTLYDGILTITSNDPVNSSVQLTMSGEGTPGPPTRIIVTSPDSLKFGLVTKDSTAQQFLTIQNDGNSMLNVTAITSSNPLAFVVIDAPTISQPLQIAASASQNVKIEFRPKLVQSYSADLTVRSDATNNKAVIVPMKGRCVAAPTPNIVFNVGIVDFGEVKLGRTEQRQFLMSNQGNATLIVTTIQTNNNVFEVVGSKSFSLLPKENTNITVNFHPNAEQLYEAQLTVISNTDPANMPLRGRGRLPKPKITLDKALLAFGEVKLNKFKELQFSITNEGDSNLVINNIQPSNAAFSITSATQFTLLPTQSQNVMVKFQPTVAQDYQSQVNFVQGQPADPSPPAIIFTGKGTTLVVTYDPGSLPTEITPNNPVTISLQTGSSLAGGFARLFFKEGGKKNYDSTAMSLGGANIYSANIPALKIGKRGTIYYMKVSDGDQIKTLWKDEAAQKPFILNVTYSNTGFEKDDDQPAGTEQTFYRMVSIPLNLTNPSLATILAKFNGGQADINKWRLFTWSSSYKKYVENGESGFPTVGPGKGFWFITSEIGKLQTGAGITTVIDQNYSMSLQPGWNMIGNPFYFNVKWDEVVKSTNISAIYYYTGSDFVIRTDMIPWEGYFVKNNLNNPETVLIPPLESGQSGLKKNELALDGKQWQLRLRSHSGLVADEYNFIGMLNDADESYDLFDVIESPYQPGEYLKLFFPHQDWGDRADDYGSDYRPLNDKGAYWDFEVKTSSSADNVNLKIDGLETLPVEFDAFLIDKELGLTQNVRDRVDYSFGTGKGKEITHSFRLVVGTNDYIADNNLGISTIPEHFELSQNFPNPFNPTTSIKFLLPAAAQVSIKVFNILGQEVKTLVDQEVEQGYHTVIWDATNYLNQPASNGLYFYQINAATLDGSNKTFGMTRKMMLLK